MLFSGDAALSREYLRRHNFQSFLPQEAIGRLRLCSFSDGEYLCREGEAAGFLHFLVDGRCKVTRFLGNGKESLICFYRNFAVLGEVELIDGLFRKNSPLTECWPLPEVEDASAATTNVQAIGPCWCLCLPMESAQETLMDSAFFLRYLCGHLSQKLTRSIRNLSISLNYPVDERLASYIACVCQGEFFQDNYTHLAEYLGCSHRQLLRVLHRFCEEGILEKRQRAYRILDRERLKGLAGDIYPFPQKNRKKAVRTS